MYKKGKSKEKKRKNKEEFLQVGDSETTAEKRNQ